MVGQGRIDGMHARGIAHSTTPLLAGTRARVRARGRDEEERDVPRSHALPAQMDLGVFSKAGGPWEVDWKAAHADAQATLASIDFTRSHVLIWVPGTDATGVHRDFQLAADYQYGRGGDVSVTALKYDAAWALRRSLPTGLATMKLVLEGIRQRLEAMPAAQRPKILLGGLSQGAWIIGEAAADPKLSGVITRAMLVGHPWLAKTQYTDDHDPRIKVLNHPGDQITMPVAGDAGVGLDAMIAVRTGKLGSEFGTVAKAILANPLHGVLLLHTTIRDHIGWLRPYLRDPHQYGYEMSRLVRYLRTGTLDRSDAELDDLRNGRPPGSS
jgi:hypothetical protein